jgi:surface protein
MSKLFKCLINRISNKGTIVKMNNRTLKTAVNEWLENSEKAEHTYGHISKWDTSQVTNMKKLFFKAPLFNEPIGDWDVSNVTDMSYMFRNDGMDIGATFNQPIGDWDVSKVTTMEEMFSGAASFNQDISSWDVSRVTTMKAMLYGNNAFNQAIGNWDVCNVKNISFMLYDAIAFNQDLSNWDTRNISGSFSFSYNTPQWTLPKPNLLILNPQ